VWRTYREARWYHVL